MSIGALVTGGGAGIGKAIVEAYGALGAKIAVAEIHAGKVAALNAGFKTAGIDGIGGVGYQVCDQLLEFA